MGGWTSVADCGLDGWTDGGLKQSKTRKSLIITDGWIDDQAVLVSPPSVFISLKAEPFPSHRPVKGRKVLSSLSLSPTPRTLSSIPFAFLLSRTIIGSQWLCGLLPPPHFHFNPSTNRLVHDNGLNAPITVAAPVNRCLATLLTISHDRDGASGLQTFRTLDPSTLTP